MGEVNELGIKKYFKKEIYKHYILGSIPFIAIILIYICQILCLNKADQQVVLWMALIYYAILFSVGMILISIYVYTYKKYKKKLSLFSSEELERINNEAKTAYNMGKILITNDVVIFFSLFKKNVVPIKEIEGIDKVEGTWGLRYVRVDYKTIILKCKDNTQIMIYSPKNYNYTEFENCIKIITYIMKNKKLNKEILKINELEEAQVFKNYKEFRLSNIMEYFVAIPYLLICLIINMVIETCITNSSDFVLKIFYSMGIKHYLFSKEMGIYTIIFIILYVYYKGHDKNIVKGNTTAKSFKLPMIGLLILFCRIFTIDFDYEKDVRSDYLSYLKNECVTYTGKITSYKGVDHNEVTWAGYYHGEKNYLFADDKILVFTEGSIDENKNYEITYLPKTHLIVNINEETD